MSHEATLLSCFSLRFRFEMKLNQSLLTALSQFVRNDYYLKPSSVLSHQYEEGFVLSL